jgi:thioester reductase-like protein
MNGTRSKNILLTGFPGFIARRLVRKLLMSDDAVTLTLIVESEQMPKAHAAMERLASAYGASKWSDDRVRLLTGDITAIDLGLSGEEYRLITQNVHEIYHLAAVHALSVPARTARSVNISGTKNMLTFAANVRNLDCFVHFSSAYVSGDFQGVIMEDELAQGQRFRNNYEATKYEAELAVRAASEQLPVIIIRPAGVVGDSRTGEIDRFDSVYQIGMLLVGSPVAIALPLAGTARAPLNLVPVDYLVDAVYAVVQQRSSLGKTFHVVDPNPLSARRVYEAVAARSGRKRTQVRVSTNLSKVLLRIPGMERFSSVSHLAIDYLNHMAFYNSRNTMLALEGTGIRCPPFDEYVENLMRYVRDYFDQAGEWNDAHDPLKNRL